MKFHSKWGKIGLQLSQTSYTEWDTKHVYTRDIHLSINHHDLLEIEVDGRYVELRATGLYEALREYFS